MLVRWRSAVALVCLAVLAAASDARACEYEGGWPCDDPRSIVTPRALRPGPAATQALERLEWVAERCATRADLGFLDHVRGARTLGDLVRRMLDWPAAEKSAWQARAWALDARYMQRQVRAQLAASALEQRP
jgi:hypothetical protein